MKCALFCIPLKKGCLEQFKEFVKQTHEEKSEEWKEMLSRYDLSSVKVWYKNFNGVDYVFVYHDAGETYEEKLKGWDTSTHPFDIWFNAQIMAVYDVANVEGMESPAHLLTLFV